MAAKTVCAIALLVATRGAKAEVPGGTCVPEPARDPREASAFHFDPDGRDRVLIRNIRGQVVPILPKDVPEFYGKPEGYTVFARMRIDGRWRFLDVCSQDYADWMRLRGPLRPQFQDLSDGAGWPKVHVKPGVLAVDPRGARFKFYEGYAGNIELVRRVPTPHGNPFGLASKGDYLFLGTGESASGLLIIDAHDPSDMRVVADAPRGGPWILDVQAAGDLAFSADARCLNLYDVRDPLKPRVLHHFSCGAKYMSVDADRKIVYYHTADPKYLHRLDIRDPADPKPLPPWPRKYEEERSCWNVRHGDYIYAWVSAPVHPQGQREEEKAPEVPAASPRETPSMPGAQGAPSGGTEPRPVEGDLEAPDNDALLQLADEKEKEQQARLRNLLEEKSATSDRDGFYQVTRIYKSMGGEAEPKFLGEMSPGHVIHHVVGRGGKWFGLGTAATAGIAVFDLADPASPRLVHQHPAVPGAWTLSGDYLYSVQGHPDGKDGGLTIYHFADLSKPPVPIGHLNQFDRRYMEHRSGWHSTLVRGDTVFVLDYFFGLVAIDVSDKARPAIVGGLHTAGEAFCLDVSDTRVFIGENMGGLCLVDNRVPEQARIVGNFGIGGGWGVFARGDVAFCANLSGLMIVDTADPKRPVELSYSGDIANALEVKVRGNYAYCMGNVGYGDIFDVSDLRNPVRLSRFRTRRAFRLDVQGDYLYVADHQEGLVIFDVSDRKTPVRIATFACGGAGTVTVKGRYAFVGAPPGLQVIDVSDPAKPLLYAVSKTGASGPVVGDCIYSTSYFGGNKLQVTDLSDLRHPRFLEGFDPGYYSYATQCAVHGEYLYLCSLPYLSICKAPMSPEAPKAVVAVNASTMPIQDTFPPQGKDDKDRLACLKLLPTRTGPSEASATDLHQALARLERTQGPGKDDLFHALSELSVQRLGLDFQIDAPLPLVPGYAETVTLRLRNQGQATVTFEAAGLSADHPRARVQALHVPGATDLRPGGEIVVTLRLGLEQSVPVDERVQVTAECIYRFEGSKAAIRREGSIRACEPITVTERIPRLDVSNIRTESFSCSVTNNIGEPQRLTSSLDLPKGWTALPGPEVEFLVPARQTKEMTFSCCLPDQEVPLGETPISLRIRSGDASLYEKSIETNAERKVRWRVMGPFGFDVTSRNRPVPEREVVFGKRYEAGHAWQPYVCPEAGPVDLCRPPGGANAGSVLMYYGATSILSDRRRPCRFSIAADPAILSGPREIKGWLNGKQVIGSPIDLAPSSSEPLPSTDDEGGKDGRSLLVEGEPDSKRDAPVFLEEGWNLLLIRVCWINNWHFGGYWFQSTPKWPFRISLNDPSGTPIRNLTFDSERWRPTGHDGRPQP